MEATVPIGEILKSVDLAWWPEFLLHDMRYKKDAGASGASLQRVARALSDEESMA
jgi:hypothetical protein